MNSTKFQGLTLQKVVTAVIRDLYVRNMIMVILSAFFATVINPGDEVIIPTPCWVSYVDQVKMVEGVPVTFQTTEANQFKATVEQLEAARTSKPGTSARSG